MDRMVRNGSVRSLGGDLVQKLGDLSFRTAPRIDVIDRGNDSHEFSTLQYFVNP
ncbi:hypothetical protein [Luteolibacter marinus]|uniref:hypothetical protein n=1 Tax=Luteolibacter marinus TaxID=2776705 RepID=UPI001D012EA4|nr:hypothetical protein [Luteolibacter marinus]